MNLSSFKPSGTSRRAAAALLLSAALALTCAPPAHAWGGFGRPTADSPQRTASEGGLFHFLLRLFGLANITMETNGTMDPNGHQ
ncbi:MAG TPA: hypothetical protein VGS07_04765 [Thermoanaerobaculia bacterium]|jgi:hypothetical protein|nr:hypothetical protein [Thermoanaerobaculia bacterium]